MKIADSNVVMTSKHNYTEETASTEYLKAWDKDKQIELKNGKTDKVELSEESKDVKLSVNIDVTANNDDDDNKFTCELSDADKQKIQLIKKLLESLKGKDYKFYDPSECLPKIKNCDGFKITIDFPTQSAQQGVGWGLIYNRVDTHYESESTSFNAAATVTTQDGRTINTNLMLQLDRVYASTETLDIRAGDALKDPLVINFAAQSASVTNQKYDFDIDADGVDDHISFVGQGSGFMSIDKNGDGIINDGSELFGTKSSNGFFDLASYDLDKNGWIDENDKVFGDLKIWSKDAFGNDVLSTLSECNIGAIYLGSASTNFKLNDSDNNTNAQIRRTGIFLTEDGTAGTVQHVDLAV